jgi:hypothetical protein
MAYPEGIRLQEDETTPDYVNESVFKRNTLPPRSYHIPETALNLNGSWDFNYASSPLKAPEPSASTPGEPWPKIEVPGHWQLQGYGIPHYTNVQYPIPVCPPYVPSENATGTYVRSFQVPSTWSRDSNVRLRFDGVDSAYHVWVNQVLIGYAQGSRNAHEFDVTRYIDWDGPNQVHVRVYRWSDGTYIEDQDQWWLSGLSPWDQLPCICRVLTESRHIPRCPPDLASVTNQDRGLVSASRSGRRLQERYSPRHPRRCHLNHRHGDSDDSRITPERRGRGGQCTE